MDCHYCALQRVTTRGRGLCAECSVAVCTKPPQRADGVFHADSCGCGCGRLVCEAHAAAHAHGHGGDTPSCFPFLSLQYGRTAWRVASRIASTPPPRPSGPLLTLTHFMNAITPGSARLRDQIAQLYGEAPSETRFSRWLDEGSEHPALNREVWGKTAEPFVLLPARFFNRERQRRVWLVVADAVGTAWTRARDQREPLGAFSKSESAVLDLLGDWVRGDLSSLPVPPPAWLDSAADASGVFPFDEASFPPDRPPRQPALRAQWLFEGFAATGEIEFGMETST